MIGASAVDAAALEVLQAVRARVRQHVSVALYDADALSIALSCGMTEATALLEYGYDRSVRADAIANAKHLALTDDEYVILFGTPDAAAPKTRLGGEQKFEAYESVPEAKTMRNKLEHALSTTLAEPAQRSAWQRSACIRTASAVALGRASDVTACVSATVGGLVRADTRRLDDLRSSLQDDHGIDVLVMAQAIGALASVFA